MAATLCADCASGKFDMPITIVTQSRFGERVRVRGAGRMTLKSLFFCMRFPPSYLSFLIFVFNLLISPCLYAQSSLQPALIEGAKKEGKLVWYTSMAVDTSKPLLDAFLKDYPFIQAELVRLGEEQLMTRILSEMR